MSKRSSAMTVASLFCFTMLASCESLTPPPLDPCQPALHDGARVQGTLSLNSCDLGDGTYGAVFVVSVPSSTFVANGPVEFEIDAVGQFTPGISFFDSKGFLAAFKRPDTLAGGKEHLIVYLPAGEYKLVVYGRKGEFGSFTLETKLLTQARIGCQSVWVVRGVDIPQSFSKGVCPSRPGVATYFLGASGAEPPSITVDPGNAAIDPELVIHDYATGVILGSDAISYSTAGRARVATVMATSRGYVEIEARDRGIVGGPFRLTVK